jgi:hypothetical protein
MQRALSSYATKRCIYEQKIKKVQKICVFNQIKALLLHKIIDEGDARMYNYG